MTMPRTICRSRTTPSEMRAGARLCLGAWVLVLAGMLGLGGVRVAAQNATSNLPVILADFNHDGIPDLLIPSLTSPTATIAFGTLPYGTFSPNPKSVTLPPSCDAPTGPTLVGDFNGDGFPDIAFVCATTGTGGVLLGVGDGTFGPVKTIQGVVSVASTYLSVAGDFNKDGKLDLVVLGLQVDPTTGTSTQGIQFFAGNGDGTFASPVFTAFAAGVFYVSPVVADVNGDGSPDIVVGNFASGAGSTLDVFGNNRDGTFGIVAQGVASPSASAAVGMAGSSDAAVQVGSFFAPGSVDFAVNDYGTTAGLFLVKNTSDGGGYSLAAGVKQPFTGLTGALAGHFTGSGLSDLLVGTATGLSVFSNDGTGNFAASYTNLTLPSTAAPSAVADANGDGYADLYSAVLQGDGSLRLSVDLVAGSATATSQPFSLAAGTRAVGANWPGNALIAGSSASGTQTVQGATNAATITTVASSENPSKVGDTVTFTVAVSGPAGTTALPTGTVTLSDGTTVLGSGLLTGAGTFTVATSGLTAGTHSITASYAGDATFAASVSPVLSQVVTAVPLLTLSSIAPATARVNDPATIVTLTGSGFTVSSVAQVNGAAIATTYVNSTTLTAVVPATDLAVVGTLQLTVFDSSINAVSSPLTFTVVPAAPVVTFSGPTTTPPGSQPALAFTIVNPYPVDLTATLTLSFAGAASPPVDDPAIQFASGGRTLTFTIPANTTAVPPIQLQAGTDAGTITIPLKLTAEGVDVTPATLVPLVITVPAAVPVASTVTVTRTGNQLSVAIHGFSNTRELTQATFHFAAAAGATIDTPNVTADVGRLFTTWYGSDASIQVGSTFTYTQIFNVSDDASNVGQVTVTLTNSVGVSTAATAQ